MALPSGDVTMPSSPQTEISGSSFSSGEDKQNTNTTPRTESILNPSQGNAAIHVLAVVDGDTIKIRLSNGTEETVRIIGIDTPEMRPVECFGREATEKMRLLVEGKTIALERDPADDRDNFGRLLRYVFVDGQDAGATMIRDGYAHSYKQFPHPRLEEYNALERDARLSQRGLWGDVCGKPEIVEDEASSPAAPTPPPPSNSSAFSPVTSSSSAAASPSSKESSAQSSPPQETQGCIIKGNVNSKKEHIYHFPGCGSYEKTQIHPEEGDQWFCSEVEAQAAGFRKAGNCP